MSAATAAAYEQLRRNLGAACAVQRDSDGQPVPVVVNFTTRGGSEYFFNAYARKPVFDYEHATTGDFLLSFVVPDGLIYGADLVSSGAITRPSGGGFHLPTVVPISSSATTGGSVILTNPGTADAFPIITLTGPLTDPYISLSATGEFMQLNYDILGGDVITIDMANHTILLNGSLSLVSAKVSGSSWWSIPAGTTSISLSTSNTSDTGNAQVSFYPVFTAA
jgi:hypothetical protein